MKHHLIALGAIAASALSASAQSFNIEWGSQETSPPATYAAEGLPGVWNTFSAMPNFQRLPLLGLDGELLTADIMNIGFDVIEASDIPGTTDGDQALLDDCFTSFNDPVDGCIFMRFLEPGDYQVIMYSIAPDDGSLINRLRIDQNLDAPEFVGGTWSGTHENGITFMTQNATVGINGRLDLHSGLNGGNIRSVLNGIQVIKIEPCPADINGDDQLNFFDVGDFLTAYAAEDEVADINDDGSFNFFDVGDFLAAYAAGCP